MAGESLKVVAGNATGTSIALDAELVMGRSTPGLGSLGGDSEISRVHARVYHDAAGQLMVEDLGSTNGTFVNGARIAGAQALRAGDQVRVGQTTMIVGGLAIGGVFSSDDSTKTAVTIPVITTPATPPPATTTPATPPPAAMPAPPSSTPSSGGYPPGFEKGFVASCASSGKLSKSQ